MGTTASGVPINSYATDFMDSKRSTYKADIALALVLLVGSGFVYWESLALPESPYEPMGPAFVPQALSVLIGLCAFWVLAQGIVKWRSRALTSLSLDAEAEQRTFVRHPWLAVAGVLFLFGYILLMHLKILGFRSATVLFILTSGLSMMRYEKKSFQPLFLLTLVIIACVMGFGGYYLFTKIFVVDLP